MVTWKEKLISKLPKFTRKQIFYIIAIISLLAIIIFVPMSIKWNGFSCDKQGVEIRKK